MLYWTLQKQQKHKPDIICSVKRQSWCNHYVVSYVYLKYKTIIS